MIDLILSRKTAAWFLLVAATVVSWEMGHGGGFGDLRTASATIIVLAMIKIRFVILDFMELRHAPFAARLAGEAWVVGVCAVLLGIYLVGTAVPA